MYFFRLLNSSIIIVSKVLTDDVLITEVITRGTVMYFIANLHSSDIL